MKVLMHTSCVLVAALTLLPALAEAQPATPPRVSAGAGAGAALQGRAGARFELETDRSDTKAAQAAGFEHGCSAALQR